MTITTPDAPPDLTEQDWSERLWSAAAPFLAQLLEESPREDDDLAVRTNAVVFAERRAEQLAAQFPTEAPGRPARELLVALRDVRRQRPNAAPEPKGPPQAVLASAKLASELAQDPGLADRLVELTATHDRVLGGPGRPLAQYHADIAVARDRLAAACEERLTRIPQDWRRAAGAPTREERAQLAAADPVMGADR